MNTKKNKLFLGIFSLFFVLTTVVGCKKEKPEPKNEDVKFELHVGTAKADKVEVVKGQSADVTIVSKGKTQFTVKDVKANVSGAENVTAKVDAKDLKVVVSATDAATITADAKLEVDVKGVKQSIKIVLKDANQNPDTKAKFELQNESGQKLEKLSVKKGETATVIIKKQEGSAEYSEVVATVEGSQDSKVTKEGEVAKHGETGDFKVVVKADAQADVDKNAAAKLVVKVGDVSAELPIEVTEATAPTPAVKPVKFELQVGGTKAASVDVKKEGTAEVKVVKLADSGDFEVGDVKPVFPADQNGKLSAHATTKELITISATADAVQDQSVVLTVTIKGVEQTITVNVKAKG